MSANFKTELDKLAIALARKATARLEPSDKKSVINDMNLQESTDAFKALATYYGILSKPRRAKSSEDDMLGDGFSFDNPGLGENDGGPATQVRNRRQSS